METLHENSIQKSRTVGQYILGKDLGQGTFGKVRLGLHSGTGQKVAIKILEKCKMADVSDLARVTQQINILRKVRHPNLIQLYEIIENKKQLFLVMEYASEGEVFERIVRKGRLKESQACGYFQQLIAGVAYMHELGIAHRDLKPENLLLDFDGRLKIIDFGLSSPYQKGQFLKTACGSPCYAAPEMIAGRKYKGLFADIWSCGVTLFAMLCGHLPFENINTAMLYKKITAGKFAVPKTVSALASDLLHGILNTDPQRRLSIEEIQNHVWFRQPLESDFGKPYGIKVGQQIIPIDQAVVLETIRILAASGKKDTNREQLQRLISNNRHNHVVAVYYLIKKKNLRNGIANIYDICSHSFDPAALVSLSQSIQKPSSDQMPTERVTFADNLNQKKKKLSRNYDSDADTSLNSFRVSCLNKNQQKMIDDISHNFFYSSKREKKTTGPLVKNTKQSNPETFSAFSDQMFNKDISLHSTNKQLNDQKSRNIENTQNHSRQIKGRKLNSVFEGMNPIPSVSQRTKINFKKEFQNPTKCLSPQQINDPENDAHLSFQPTTTYYFSNHQKNVRKKASVNYDNGYCLDLNKNRKINLNPRKNGQSLGLKYIRPTLHEQSVVRNMSLNSSITDRFMLNEKKHENLKATQRLYDRSCELRDNSNPGREYDQARKRYMSMEAPSKVGQRYSTTHNKHCQHISQTQFGGKYQDTLSIKANYTNQLMNKTFVTCTPKNQGVRKYIGTDRKAPFPKSTIDRANCFRATRLSTITQHKRNPSLTKKHFSILDKFKLEA